MNIITILEIYFGALLMLAALAIVVNRYSWTQILGDVEDNHLVMLIAGAFALLLGITVVTSVSYEEIGPHSLLAIFGWISLLKGITIFIMPNWLVRFAHVTLNSKYLHAVAVFSFALGAVMLLIGLDVIR